MKLEKVWRTDITDHSSDHAMQSVRICGQTNYRKESRGKERAGQKDFDFRV